MIKVIERETEKTIQIEESDFDEALHIRIDTSERSESTLTVEGVTEQIESTVRAFGDQLTQSLQQFTKPQRESVVLTGDTQRDDRAGEQYDEGTRAAFGSARTRARAERQYDRLSEEQRKYRSYENDVMSHQWLLAVVNKDHEARRRIERSPAFGGQRDHTVGTDAEGGYLAPQPLANFIAQMRDAFERIAPNSFQVTSVSQTLDIPTEATVGAVNPVTEGEAVTEANSTFGQLKLTKAKAGRLAKISWELLNDQSASFSVVDLIAQQTARKLAVAWDTAAMDATPGFGVTADRHLRGTGIDASPAWTDSAAITRDEIVAALLEIPTPWRQTGNVVCYGTSLATQQLSKVDDDGGRPIYNMHDAAAIPVSDVGNAVGMVEGVPYLEVPSATHEMGFGNLREGFAVLMDGGLRIDTSADYAFNTDHITVRVLERRAMGYMQAEAFVKTPVLT
jgi:HK97 family phage major capsid protein